MPPDRSRQGPKPDHAFGLTLLLAIALSVAAILPRWSGGASISGAWYGGLLALASLALAGTALLLARRGRALVAAEAEMAKRLSELGAQVAAGTAALAESEARLRRAQRIGRVGGFEIDLRSGVNRRSQEYMTLQGMPGEARLERHADWVARLHPDDRDRAERRFLEAVSDTSGITEYAQDYRILAPGGEVRWIAARAEIERDAEGRALRMVGAHVDVTELKQAEASQRASEERLRLAQEAAGLGIWERDLRTGQAIWSPEQFALMGFDPAEGPPDRERLQARILPEDRSRMVIERVQHEVPAPRDDGSFRHQFRICHAGDGDIRSILALGRVFRDASGRAVRVVGVNLDITDRVRAEERQALLTRELDHRAKNALAVVQAALRLTSREDPDSFARAVQGRVASLTRAHTLLAEGGWSGAELRSLLQGELEPFLGAAGQMLLEGPPVRLAAVAAQPIAMAVHELATNAMKYGALSAAGGQVAVHWRLEGDRLLIDWSESGGPPVAGAPTRRGFGGRVIEATLHGQLGGTVERSWRPGGLLCRIALPAARVTALLPGGAEAPPELSFDAPATDPRSAGGSGRPDRPSP
ncbi:PAS domain-containing protein [Belnapia sp. T6]|uniref:histidine kinase n=1 Tax=Belnapia mucosa TaxID=2804532 RepID=A0ABS1V732_9PROT|nr:PAS domain-containing protein [Belnapia mucosa]MBL6457483.1 PAS domain-containing protein [Belnapia mucosa]